MPERLQVINIGGIGRGADGQGVPAVPVPLGHVQHGIDTMVQLLAGKVNRAQSGRHIPAQATIEQC